MTGQGMAASVGAVSMRQLTRKTTAGPICRMCSIAAVLLIDSISLTGTVGSTRVADAIVAQNVFGALLGEPFSKFRDHHRRELAGGGHPTEFAGAALQEQRL